MFRRVLLSALFSPAIVRLLQAVEPPLPGPELSVASLKKIARAWMDDMHEYCNVSYFAEDLNPAQTRFNRRLREFRLARPWLRGNLAPEDVFERRAPSEGSVVFYGLRHAPDGDEQVLFVANIEGKATTVAPLQLPNNGLTADGWELALAAPGLTVDDVTGPLTLENGQGLVLSRKTTDG